MFIHKETERPIIYSLFFSYNCRQKKLTGWLLNICISFSGTSGAVKA